VFHLKAISRPITVEGLLVLGGLLIVSAMATADDGLQTGEAVYEVACTSCHGGNGRGAPPSLVGFSTPLPDFADCDFAAREPDSDWVAIAYEGGPSRGFSELMPAFQGVLTVEQVQLAVNHIRSFCIDKRWPRGELNLPRALITGKAFPEDEAVLTTAIAAEGTGEIANKIVYEQRFGPRNQWEIVVPFGWLESGAGESSDATWGSAIGDIAIALKRAVYHSWERGTIVSVAGELIFPTGDDQRGFGKGTAVFEPAVTWGQILPADFFLQSQLGLELPFDTDRADRESFLRVALGWTTTSGQFGRAWSPMVELLAARELASGEDVNLDIVPQIQITLDKRQHIMLNIGVRTALNNRSREDTQVMFYVLWDWFDGTLFEGW
jgi:hypothetical protein